METFKPAKQAYFCHKHQSCDNDLEQFHSCFQHYFYLQNCCTPYFIRLALLFQHSESACMVKLIYEKAWSCSAWKVDFWGTIPKALSKLETSQSWWAVLIILHAAHLGLCWLLALKRLENLETKMALNCFTYIDRVWLKNYCMSPSFRLSSSLQNSITNFISSPTNQMSHLIKMPTKPFHYLFISIIFREIFSCYKVPP